jgi:hypothetical protein
VAGVVNSAGSPRATAGLGLLKMRDSNRSAENIPVEAVKSFIDGLNLI